MEVIGEDRRREGSKRKMYSEIKAIKKELKKSPIVSEIEFFFYSEYVCSLVLTDWVPTG